MSARRAATVPVAVVILNWNGKALSEACLRSWSAAKPAPKRLLLVDNGSADGSVAYLKRRFPRVEVLALPRNLGYAAGNNRGFEHLWAKGPAVQAVFLCNNDTEVAPDMLGRLWDALQAHQGWAAVSPRIDFHGEARIWFEGGRILPFSGRPIHLGYGKPAAAAGEAFELPQGGFLTGCGLLVRAGLLRQAGGFEEALWSYAEDSDLCLRLREGGWGLGVVPSAQMTHKVSSTFGLESPLAAYYRTRNSLWLLKRHKLGAGLLTQAAFGAVAKLQGLRSLLRGNGGAAYATYQGLWHGWIGRQGLRPGQAS